MSVLDKFAGALGRRDEGPNVALAEELAASGDMAQIDVIVGVVRSGKGRQQNDAMKVLCEIGKRRPELIAAYYPAFLEALRSSTNRQVWGAMTALDSIANARADVIAAELPQIIEAANRGSVIAQDRCTSILVKLAHAGYAEKAVPILVQRLKDAPANQFPTYAEQTASVLTPQEKPGFLAVLAERIGQIGQKSKRDRVEKLMAKLNG